MESCYSYKEEVVYKGETYSFVRYAVIGCEIRNDKNITISVMEDMLSRK